MNFQKIIRTAISSSIRNISLLIHGNPPVIKANIVTYSNNKLLSGRCALITGGTSGIGKSIAKIFVNAGAFVIITGRDKTKIDLTCEEIGRGNIIGYELDNRDISRFDKTFSIIINDLKKTNKPPIDILVNNAGILGGTISNVTEEEYDNILNTNLKGVFFLSQIVSKYMIRNKIKGNILNIASSSSLRPAISAYTISKWGIRGLTMGLARTLISHGITVNGIAPGQTATPMLKKEANDLYNKTCPLGRWILPEEIANGALFLVSDMGRAIVGDIVYMTGGAGLLSFEDMNYNIF